MMLEEAVSCILEGMEFTGRPLSIANVLIAWRREDKIKEPPHLVCLEASNVVLFLTKKGGFGARG